MPDADIGGNGSVWVGLETAYGTAVDPTAAGVGVWMPILSETLHYTEDKYYSEQIRQETIASDVKQAPYHVEGDIVMEVDANYMPYLMYASRHTITKTGTGPYVYKAVPSKKGTAYPGGTQKGLSILVVRDDVGFLYYGCVVNSWEFSIENGVLRLSAGILGLGESDPAGSVTGIQSWIAPSLFGADAHSVYVDASGTAPAFAGARDTTFNGFTFRANYNGTPRNNITPDRAATYIAYGITEATLETELDFTSKAEYNNMKNATTKAYRLESLKPGGLAGTFAAATEAFRITSNRLAYDTYEPQLSGMGDLITARVTGRGLGIAGGDAYAFECKSAANLS